MSLNRPFYVNPRRTVSIEYTHLRNLNVSVQIFQFNLQEEEEEPLYPENRTPQRRKRRVKKRNWEKIWIVIKKKEGKGAGKTS